MLNRYFAGSDELIAGERLALTGDELHHAVRVARCRPGEKIEIFNASGASAEAEFTVVDKNRAELQITKLVDRTREASLEIVLAIALIQPEKFELVLQKATELGVARFLPVISEHVEIRSDRALSKHERWERIVFEAVKQSGRVRIPQIEPPVAFEEALRRGTPVIYDADTPPSELPASSPSQVTILIGPEGGWSGGEIESARAAGAIFRKLGPRRLRAETAAIAALVDIGTRYGDLS